MNNFNREVQKAYIRGILHERKNCLDISSQLHEILAEHGIEYVDHTNCDGFCPDCGQILNCEAYKEVKGEWDGFYS